MFRCWLLGWYAPLAIRARGRKSQLTLQLKRRWYYVLFSCCVVYYLATQQYDSFSRFLNEITRNGQILTPKDTKSPAVTKINPAKQSFPLATLAERIKRTDDQGVNRPPVVTVC